MRIVLLGPPGSGKGTMAKQMIQDFKFEYIYPGELLRKEIAKKSKLGKRIKNYLERGDLVPDDMVVNIVKEKIRNLKHYIIDGFPRTIHQAKHLEKFALTDLVIFLDLPKKVILERLTLRYICPNCDAIYHLKYIKPKKDQLCDQCQIKLIQREDDKKSSVEERLRVYNKLTKPLVKFYNQKKLLKKVDAQGRPNEVYARVKKLF